MTDREYLYVGLGFVREDAFGSKLVEACDNGDTTPATTAYDIYPALKRYMFPWLNPRDPELYKRLRGSLDRLIAAAYGPAAVGGEDRRPLLYKQLDAALRVYLEDRDLAEPKGTRTQLAHELKDRRTRLAAALEVAALPETRAALEDEIETTEAILSSIQLSHRPANSGGSLSREVLYWLARGFFVATGGLQPREHCGKNGKFTQFVETFQAVIGVPRADDPYRLADDIRRLFKST